MPNEIETKCLSDAGIMPYDIPEHLKERLFIAMEKYKNAGWTDVTEPPKIGGEYNVVWDLKDGEAPVVSTMEYDAVNKKWFDTRGANVECKTVLKWRELPTA